MIQKSLFFLSSLIIILYACGSAEQKQVPLDGKAKRILNNEEPMYSFRNISTLYTEDTKKSMNIKAPLQLRYENGNERFPNGVNMERYDEKGEIKTTLVADSGFYDYKTDTYKVMGNVVVINTEEKQRMESEELNWDKKSQEIYTDTYVKITDQYQIIEGTGLRANQDFSEYTIMNIEGSTSL